MTDGNLYGDSGFLFVGGPHDLWEPLTTNHPEQLGGDTGGELSGAHPIQLETATEAPVPRGPIVLAIAAAIAVAWIPPAPLPTLGTQPKIVQPGAAPAADHVLEGRAFETFETILEAWRAGPEVRQAPRFLVQPFVAPLEQVPRGPLDPRDLALRSWTPAPPLPELLGPAPPGAAVDPPPVRSLAGAFATLRQWDPPWWPAQSARRAPYGSGVDAPPVTSRAALLALTRLHDAPWTPAQSRGAVPPGASVDPPPIASDVALDAARLWWPPLWWPAQSARPAPPGSAVDPAPLVALQRVIGVTIDGAWRVPIPAAQRGALYPQAFVAPAADDPPFPGSRAFQLPLVLAWQPGAPVTLRLLGYAAIEPPVAQPYVPFSARARDVAFQAWQLADPLRLSAPRLALEPREFVRGPLATPFPVLLAWQPEFRPAQAGARFAALIPAPAPVNDPPFRLQRIAAGTLLAWLPAPHGAQRAPLLIQPSAFVGVSLEIPVYVVVAGAVQHTLALPPLIAGTLVAGPVSQALSLSPLIAGTLVAGRAEYQVVAGQVALVIVLDDSPEVS